MFLPCRYGRKSAAKHECFQRVPALIGVSSISSMYSAIQIYQPSILKKHIETDINYIIIYMFYDIFLYKERGKEFGYYVFAPDAYAYQPRYAMLYGFKKNNTKAYEYKTKAKAQTISQIFSVISNVFFNNEDNKNHT